MGISKNNYVTAGLSGTVGQLFTFRKRGSKTIVQKVRRPTDIKPTEKLRSVRMHFASCIAYAKRAIKNPDLKALYQSVAKDGQTAFNVATSDALNPPELTNINAAAYQGKPGELIEIVATDDFTVAEVTVSIHGATGAFVEQGTAHQQSDTSDWHYFTTTENPKPEGSVITAIAMDLPGNKTSLSVIT